MLYTDSRIGTIGFNIETNTKDCKIKPNFVDKYHLNFSMNMDDENKHNKEVISDEVRLEDRLLQ